MQSNEEERCGRIISRAREGLRLAGFRFWTASFLPALVGITLPFWLRPTKFTFRILPSIEYLTATILFQAGFSFLLAWFESETTEFWSKKRMLISAGLCIGFSCLIGLHINFNLQLKSNVYEGIFIVFGFCTLFVGLLYVIPPINFYRQVGGEIVITYSLGLLPVLGAYIVQVGDITRTVYLAALPVIVITGLWVWIDKMAEYRADQKTERNSLVISFGVRLSGQVGVPAISILYFVMILAAVITGSVNPLVLAAFLLVVPFWKVIKMAWVDYDAATEMRNARKNAAILHFLTGIILTISSMMMPVPLPLPIVSW